MTNRNEILLMPDDELLRICRIEFFKGSGNGGQKRNKCSTAVRLTLELPAAANSMPDAGSEGEVAAGENAPVRISASDCSERSQFRNRSNALKKLRFRLAIEAPRCPPEKPERMEISLSNPEYFLWCARVVDAVDYFPDFREAARFLDLSPSKLEKLIRRDGTLWQYISKIIQKKLEKSEN